MILIAMLYIVGVSVCIVLAAICAERAFLEMRLPARVVWTLAICAAALCIPVVLSVRPETRPRPARSRIEQTVAPAIDHDPVRSGLQQILPAPGVLRIGVGASRVARGLDPIMASFWEATSLLALILFGIGAVRLRRLEARAGVVNVAGVDVLMTPDAGPLSFGIVRPRIVMPQWLFELGSTERELVIAHEREHARRSDPALVVLGSLSAVLMPWNPAIWYILRRLRIAIELDCDRRVLRKHPDRRTYAELLLYIAGRRTTHAFAAAGFAVTRSSLERRLLLMRDQSSRFKVRHVATLLAASGLFAAATAMIPFPSLESTASQVKLESGMSLKERATGRIRITAVSGYASFSIYSARGAFGAAGTVLHARRDTVSGIVSTNSGEVFDVDVTDGDVRIQSNGAIVHVEAAMAGSSPATWISGTGSQIRINRGGTGIFLPAQAKKDSGATSSPHP